MTVIALKFIFCILCLYYLSCCCCLVAELYLTLCDLVDCSPLGSFVHEISPPLSMKFPRQEYWSGLPFPSPGDLADTGIESTSIT